jgi:hypothetical protein
MTRATVGHDFGSTDSNKVSIVMPVAQVDTFAFAADIAATGSITMSGGSSTYTQEYITSHEATLDSLVKKINDGETNFKAARIDGRIELTAYTSAALPTVTMSGFSAGSTALSLTGGPKEVNTYTYSAAVTGAGGKYEFVHNSVTYAGNFVNGDADGSVSMGRLATAINAANLGFNAVATSATVLTITADVGSDTQMAAGTVGGSIPATSGTVMTLGAVATTAGAGKISTAVASGWPVEGTNFSGSNFASVSVDGSNYQTIDIAAGDYTGTELATLMTLQLNSKFSDEKSYKMPSSTADRTITLELQNNLGDAINKAKGPQIDTLSYVANIDTGGKATFQMASGTVYEQVFDSNHQQTLDKLAVKINLTETAFKVK